MGAGVTTYKLVGQMPPGSRAVREKTEAEGRRGGRSKEKGGTQEKGRGREGQPLGAGCLSLPVLTPFIRRSHHTAEGRALTWGAGKRVWASVLSGTAAAVFLSRSITTLTLSFFI